MEITRLVVAVALLRAEQSWGVSMKLNQIYHFFKDTSGIPILNDW